MEPATTAIWNGLQGYAMLNRMKFGYGDNSVHKQLYSAQKYAGLHQHLDVEIDSSFPARHHH